MSERNKRSPSSYDRIYAVVNRIPAGRVATYGQVAVLAGLPGHARQVGYALNALPEGHNIPWHRVVNSKGQISTRAESGFDNLQLVLLETEGVIFDVKQGIPLQDYGWEPGSRRQQCVLFDWGDTVMRVFPEYAGPMELWPRTEAIPGIGEALTEIRRYALVCLATNAADSNERAIRRALERVGLDVFFDRVFCFQKVGARKPSPAFFQHITQELGLDAKNVFMVGDEFESDVLGATDNGISAVWLNRKTEENRSGARFRTISSLETVVVALESLGFCRPEA